jgi:UDP-N-acetylmuramate--alanine ligase
VLNALSACAIADQLGLPMLEAAQALSDFQGTGRRFEVLGEIGGITVIDDYAHHPTEIRVTLSGAKDRYPGRKIWVVWQPHTYSRTKMLFNEFAASFSNADHVVVTEVYRSRETVDQNFSPAKIVQAMRHRDVHFIPELLEVTGFLLARLNSNDVLLVLSAGDANQVSAQVYASLLKKG